MDNNLQNDNNLLLEAIDIKQYFKVKMENGKKRNLKAVDGITLSVNRGETFGLVGESGCGKSSLAKSILLLYPLTAGKLLFSGQDITKLRGKALREFRCNMQMIFQDPSACLNPRRTIKQILEEPYQIHKIYDEPERTEKITMLCDMVGLSKIYLDRYPHEMSGGQKQRVGIARALALNPQLIVCDEPVSALDVSIQAQVINLLQDLQEELSLTYIFISHNLSVVRHVCDKIAVMYLGRFVETADVDEIYDNTLHPYTKALISAVPTLDETGKRERIILKGDLPSPLDPPEGCAFHARCNHAFELCKKKQPELVEIERGHCVACHLYNGDLTS